MKENLLKQYWYYRSLNYLSRIYVQKYKEYNYIMLFHCSLVFHYSTTIVIILSMIYGMVCNVYKLEKLSWERSSSLWSLKHLLATLAFSCTYAFYALITHYYFRGKLQETVSAFQKKKTALLEIRIPQSSYVIVNPLSFRRNCISWRKLFVRKK